MHDALEHHILHGTCRAGIVRHIGISILRPFRAFVLLLYAGVYSSRRHTLQYHMKLVRVSGMVCFVSWCV